MELNELELNVEELKTAAHTLRAVNHKLRQKIMQLINQMQNLTVTEIYIKLRIEQSVASQHLAILRNAGLVNTDRNGRLIYYSINYEKLNEVQELSKELLYSNSIAKK